MTAQAVGYRVLSPRAVLLGPGDPDALENVIPGPLADGALAWVTAENGLYFLAKQSVAAVAPPSIIATAYGASAPGRWILYSGGAGSILPLSNVFWVDSAAAPGGTGSITSPFSTIAAAVLAVPTGSTLLVCPGTYAGAALGDKSLTFIAEAGQRAPGLVDLGTLTYDSAIAQQLCFRNCLVITDCVGASASTQIVFDHCPDATSSGAGNTALVRGSGDPSCIIRGRCGVLIINELVVEDFDATVFAVNNVQLNGNVTASVEFIAYGSLWATAKSVTAPIITTDSFTFYGALDVGATFSATPVVKGSWLGNTPGHVLTCQPDGKTWQGEAPSGGAALFWGATTLPDDGDFLTPFDYSSAGTLSPFTTILYAPRTGVVGQALFGIGNTEGADTTATLTKNGVDTAIVATILNGQSIGYDTTHTVSVTKGDALRVRVDGNAGGNNPQFQLLYLS